MKTKGANLSQINLESVFNPSYLGKYRWKRDKPDSRDHMYQLAAITLPSSVDLRQYCTPVEDQGNLGSCTGNAIAGQIELINKKKTPTKTPDISRLFIYYEERVMIGTVRWDSGAYIRDGIKVVNKKGAPRESLWPYQVNKFATKPGTAVYKDALTRTVTGYQKCSDFNAVKNALAAGNPVVIGFDVYESFESNEVAATGVMPYPKTNSEQLLGGHAVCIVGYYDNFRNTGRGYFVVRNSWGTSWGDQGYFYMPYEVIQNKNMSDDFWLISAVKNP